MSTADYSLDNKIRAYLDESYPHPVTMRVLAKSIATNSIEGITCIFRSKISSRLQSLKRSGVIVRVEDTRGWHLGWRLRK
jgi:hypothetical protein